MHPSDVSPSLLTPDNLPCLELPGIKEPPKPRGDYYTREYQKQYLLYQAQLRKWTATPILEGRGKWLVTNSDGTSRKVQAIRHGSSHWFDCGCEDYVKQELGVCIHTAALQRLFNQGSGVWTKELLSHVPPQHVLSWFVRYISEKGNFGGLLPFEDQEERQAFYDGDLEIDLEDLEDNYMKRPEMFTDSCKTAMKLWRSQLTYKRDVKFTQLVIDGKVDALNVFPEITARDYQETSIKHMLGWKRCALALKMGMGKTFCAIAAMYLIDKHDPEGQADKINIVVCPSSLKDQWKREIKRFVPSYDPFVINSGKDALLWKTLSLEQKLQHKFVVLNYEILHRHTDKFIGTELNIKNFSYGTMILDEVQKIKNKETESWKAVKKIKADRCYPLSGTIVENKLEDFLSIMEVLNEKEIQPKWKFVAENCIVEGTNIKSFKNLSKLRGKFENYLLNPSSSKEPPLPTYTETVIKLPLTPIQEEWHDKYFSLAKPLLSKGREGKLRPHEQIMLNSYLSNCRMISNDLRLLAKSGSVTQGEKIIHLYKMLEDWCVNQGQKVVLFSEYTTMHNLITKDVIEPLGIKSVYLDGSMNGKQRSASIKQFIEDPDTKLFVGSEAAGAGVDGLQWVSWKMIHFEISWNPGKTDQRRGRLVRLGQKAPHVEIVMLMTNSGIEEMIENAVSRKRDVRAEVISLSKTV